MALRLILVGLVASMGFELPSSHDLETWGQSGRNWVAARVSEISTISTWQDLAAADEAPEVADVEPAPEAPAEITRANPVDDLAFEVVVEGMASSFTEDVATARIEAERAEAALAAIAENELDRIAEAYGSDDPLSLADESPVVAEADPIVADEPPVVADEPPVVAEADPAPESAVGPALEAPLPAPEVVAAESGPTRVARLATAVRLTRDAVEAWASLIGTAGSIRGVEQVVLSR